MKPAVAITVGDYNGIGPEVVLKSIRHPSILRICRPVLVGPREAFSHYAGILHYRIRFMPVTADALKSTGAFAGFLHSLPSGNVALLESSSVPNGLIQPGLLAADAGSSAVKAIEQAASLAVSGKVAAMVTAPVSKRAIHLAGGTFPGQTEMVQHIAASPTVAMMLVSPILRVGLVTIHIPVSDIASLLTGPLIQEKIEVVHAALIRDWAIPAPRIAVLALNPHAGEGGDIGQEEERIIVPVIDHCRKRGMDIQGPFPADAFFGRYQPRSYHAVMAMYHDQGLIPLKMSSSGRAVNVSAGLSIVRTSPDHGTAFDIAGRKKANPSSMIEAIRLAVRIAHNRQRASSRRGS